MVDYDPFPEFITLASQGGMASMMEFIFDGFHGYIVSRTLSQGMATPNWLWDVTLSDGKGTQRSFSGTWPGPIPVPFVCPTRFERVLVDLGDTSPGSVV